MTGAQNGDTFTESFATTATTTSAVGSYPIVPSVTGTNLGNYTVNIVNGALTVTGRRDHDHVERAGQRCLRQPALR